LHTLTNLAAVLVLVALMVAVVVPSVLAMVVPSVVMESMGHRRTAVVAFVVARHARLVACVHLLQCRTFFRSLCRGALWICGEHLVQHVNLELGASLTLCTLACRAAFFDAGKIVTCFHVRFQWPWTLGVALHSALRSCNIVICCATVVAAMRILNLSSQGVFHLSAQPFELQILTTYEHVPTPVVLYCYEGRHCSKKSNRYKKTSDTRTLHLLRM
jgi:hypothetical protein